jgi:hypothetical protein
MTFTKINLNNFLLKFNHTKKQKCANLYNHYLLMFLLVGMKHIHNRLVSLQNSKMLFLRRKKERMNTK